MTHLHKSFDVLVIGTGAAGLAAALSLSDNTRIALISKDALCAGASPRAQGGIAAVIEKTDSTEQHIQDTLIAGAGLCDPEAVRFTVENGKSAIQWLVQQGVQFTKLPNNVDFHLTKEGGHSHRRILHIADQTGNAVINSLTTQVKNKKNITCFTQHTAIDLIIKNQQCIGANILDNHTGEHKTFLAKATLLATGGASSVYLHTSNADMATGDGIAMAARAGCELKNLEFNQFHPTCLYNPGKPAFLITEAVRGEGGILRLADGTRFMPNYDKRAELAPRDIVARAIDSEIKKNKLTHVYLDMTHFPKEKINTHFPTIAKHCLKQGIHVHQDLIPVVPAAHYTCGGVKTNHYGETNIANLFAVGEVAYTGLHGANRMASNSLLECIVFAASAAQHLQLVLPTLSVPTQYNPPYRKQITRTVDTQQLTQDIQMIMWEKVGIVRNNKDLHTALSQLSKINHDLNTNLPGVESSKSGIELRNLALTAALITQAAIAQKNNCGLHFNTDLA